MSQSDYASILASIRDDHETQPLSIISLSQPIINAATISDQSPSTRRSDASNSDISDNPTPTQLLADLTHYRDLFSKLRFSYSEQVTKEKYLRSIVGEPPLLVSHAENVELEEKLAHVKAELKRMKVEVDALVEEMEGMARDLAARWTGVQAQLVSLETLPAQVESLEDVIEGLRAQLVERQGREPGEMEPRMNLGLEETDGLVAQQRERAKELEREIARLQGLLPAKMRECEAVEGELNRLERRRNEVAGQAGDARRAKGEGRRDELEEKGRWFRSAEVVLSGMGVAEVAAT